MSVHQIVQRRRDALLNHFCNNGNMPALLAVPSAQTLGQITFIDGFDENHEQEQLGRRRTSSVLIHRGPGDRDSNTSLWVAAGYSGYARAYRAFLKEVYGVTATSNDMAPYNVDHLLNRARAPESSAFVRVEAISGPSNQIWGSIYESKASNPEIRKNQQGYRYMSLTIAAKVAGFPPPRSADDAEACAAIEDYFIQRGQPEATTRGAVGHMLGRDMG